MSGTAEPVPAAGESPVLFRAVAALRRALGRLAAVRPATWIVLGAVGLSTWFFWQLSLRMHEGLATSAFDLGLYDQGMWLLSRFKAPFVTVMGRNLFGDHTSFILLPLVPLYWIAPGVGTLFFVQSLAMSAGAIPVFLYARRRLQTEAGAVLCAFAFLLNPALCWANLEGFHPDAFLSVLFGFALYAALTERWRMYVVFVILTALVKEDTWLVLIPLGAWVALRRRPDVGLLTVAGAAVYPLAVAPVIMGGLTGLSMPNTWRVPFGGPTGFLAEAVKRPGNVFSYLTSEGRPWYLWQMTAPFALAFLRAPGVALTGALVMGVNILSNFGYQHQIGYHYSIVVIPALALGTVHALGAMTPRWRGRMLGLMLLASLWAALLWGPLPFGRNQPAYYHPAHPSPVAAREVMAVIPDDAVVSAHYRLVPHLTHRDEIYMFTTPFRAIFYGPGTGLDLEGQTLPAADRVTYVVLPVRLEDDVVKTWEAIKGDFVLVADSEYWQVYQRR